MAKIKTSLELLKDMPDNEIAAIMEQLAIVLKNHETQVAYVLSEAAERIRNFG